MNEVMIVKASGVKEPFNEEKLRRSIRRAGIPDRLSDRVVAHIRERLFPDIPTSEIYKHILEFLEVSDLPPARFSLKRAIMELGPSGFPFEKFVARIFSEQGYTTSTDQILQGACVTHEVDVVAIRDSAHLTMECKFHNRPGSRTDIKTALYVWARFEDLREYWNTHGDTHDTHEMWLVTNTKCTVDAIQYARCRGLKIISWGYPETGNLQDLIESKKLHPLTALMCLSTYQKQLLLRRGIVVSRDIPDHKELYPLLRLTPDQEKNLTSEIASL